MAKGVYGANILTALAILFLIVLLPWSTSAAVNMAYLSGGENIARRPIDLHAANASNVGGPITLSSWHDYGNNYSFKWDYFVDRPSTSTTFSSDCEPYDWGAAAVGFPVTNYSIVNYFATNLTRTEQYVWADSPFKAPAVLCSTTNDDIGIRITPAAILGSLHRGGQYQNKTLGLAMTNFNASMSMFRAGINGYNSSLFAEYDWRVEIDGDYMFGENVRAGSDDSLILNEGNFGNDSLFYPKVKFRHDLSIDEERRVRDAIAGKSLSAINMTLIFRCHETISKQAGFPLVHEACEFMQSATTNIQNTDAAFNVQTTWVEADDYDFWIQGAAWVLAILMFVMAIASTPLWDPFKKVVQGR